MTLKVHCPECRGQFQVDGEESRTRFDCPFCSAPFRFQDKQTVVLSSSPLTEVHVEKLANPEAAPAQQTSASADAKGDLRAAVTKVPVPPPKPEKRNGKPPVPPTPPAKSSPEKPLPKRTPLHHAEAPSPNDLTPLRPGDVINGYRLEEVIGWGGMSVVFRAQQLSLGRNVALKVMRHELGEDPEFSRRFLNEARALAELSHANIVQVIDQGIHEGNHYLVMEFIDGVSLREVLAERRLSPAEALHFVPELCAALEYAHERGIIHRDIKPENILVTKSGIPKIADFGLVRMMGTHPEEISRITQTRTILGTVDYMAPEQREGQRDVDHRADIYSLGVVLYEMLTGELPIARFPLPSERVEVDVRLDDVVLKVLQKDRDRRYQKASMVATDLRELDSLPRAGVGLEGGSQATRRRSATPHTLIGQIVSLAWFPLVVMFFVAASREEEVGFAAMGAAIPWLALQCRSYGWLPPIPEWLLGRRWLLFVAGGVLIALAQNHEIRDEPAALAVALCFSAAFALKRPTWEEDAEISTGIFRTKERPGGARTSSHPNHGGMTHAARASRVSSSVVSPSTPPTAGDDDSQPSDLQPTDLPPHLASTDSESDEAKSEEETMSSKTLPRAQTTLASVDPLVAAELSDREEARRRSRPSPLIIIAFIFTLATLLYTAGVSIPLFVAGDDWQETAFDLPFDFHEVDQAVGEIAHASPEAIRPLARLVRTAMFLPFALPILLTLIALPGIVQRRRRGFATMVVIFGLLFTQIAVLATSTDPIHRTIDRYCETYTVAHGDAESLLLEAEQQEDAVTRLALLHRAASAPPAEFPDREAGAPLVRTALDPSLSQLERMIALSLLAEEYRIQLSDPDAFSSVPRWQSRFAQLAEVDSRLRPQLREGVVAMLRHVPDPELAGVFSDYIELSYTPERYYALAWWLEVAPEATFEQWVESIELNGCSAALTQLLRSSPTRVRSTPRGLRLHEVVDH